MKYSIGDINIECTSIDKLKEFVVELSEGFENNEMPKQLNDFVFAVESDYQSFYNLDKDDWDILIKKNVVKEKLNRPRFNNVCPVCNNREVYKSIETPDTMEECTECGAEWNIEGDLTLDPRDEMSYNEIVHKGWAIDLNE